MAKTPTYKAANSNLAYLYNNDKNAYFSGMQAMSGNSSIASNKKTNKKKLNIDNTYDLNNYVNQNTTSTGGSGGYYTLDITNMLNAYNQQADADRAVAQQTYDTTRNDLLTSLKRYQEQNAQDVANRKRAYLSEQASLESAREAADRQTRIDSAARGLGGSGLQQLAQLQNLINQGQDISDIATSNQQDMDTLRKALAQYTEDTNTKLDNANKTYDNAIKQINAQLANNIAQAEAQRAASWVAPSGGSSNRADVQANANAVSTALTAAIDSFKGSIGSTKKGNQKSAYENAKQTVYGILQDAGMDASSGAGKKALSNLKSIYNYYKK